MIFLHKLCFIFHSLCNYIRYLWSQGPLFGPNNTWQENVMYYNQVAQIYRVPIWAGESGENTVGQVGLEYGGFAQYSPFNGGAMCGYCFWTLKKVPNGYDHLFGIVPSSNWTTFITYHEGLPALSSPLSTSGPITSLPVKALSNAVANGSITITFGLYSQEFNTPGAAKGSHSIPISSTTPNFDYPVNSAITQTVGQGGTAPDTTVVLQGMEEFGNAVKLANCLFDPRMALTFQPYQRTILNDSATYYWRLGDSSNAVLAIDSMAQGNVSQGNLGTVVNVTLGLPPLTTSLFDTAASFNGISSQIISSILVYPPLTNFAVEIIFKTSATGGCGIMGFANNQTSTPTTYDRVFYIGTDNKLHWGCQIAGTHALSTSTAVNDGLVHHAVGNVLLNGSLELYFDGMLVAYNYSITGLDNWYGGYWRIGYGYANKFDHAPSSPYFNGELSQVVTYQSHALTPTQVANHYSIIFPSVVTTTGTLTSGMNF